MTAMDAYRGLVALALVGVALAGCDAAPRDEARRETLTTPTAQADVPARAPASRTELGAEARIVYQRTLVRDAAPACAELTAGITRATDALLEVVERAEQPPWSGMRAATCLVREHGSEIEPQMLRWVASRATMGLALLVLGDLDRLDPAMGERVARAALSGENAERARSRIARSRHHAHLVQ